MDNQKAETSAIQWLALLNSPEITAEQTKAFFQWMEASAQNQCAYIKAEQLWEQGSELARIDEPVSTFTLWMTQRQFFALACSITIMLVCTSLFYLNQAPLMQEFQSAIGEQHTITLEDGTVVTLNTDTQLRIDLQSNKRLAYVDKGEVFFSVQKDNKRPFDVITQSGTVRVVGTQFSVHNTGADAVVTVIEGKVALASLIVTANQQVSMVQASTGALPESIDAKAELSWRKRELIYRSEPLGQVIKDLNRYYKAKISLATPSLENMEVIAVLQLNGATTTATTLAAALNLDVTTNSDATIITLTSAVQQPPKP